MSFSLVPFQFITIIIFFSLSHLEKFLSKLKNVEYPVYRGRAVPVFLNNPVRKTVGKTILRVCVFFVFPCFLSIHMRARAAPISSRRCRWREDCLLSP